MQNNLATKQHSTLQEFNSDEKWEVTTGKDTFTITGLQAQKLREATTSGLRGIVWFDGFAISIPHIISVKRTSLGNSAISKRAEELREQFGVK